MSERNGNKNTNNVTYGTVLEHSQRGTNVPIQPVVPKMPPVKTNTNTNKK